MDDLKLIKKYYGEKMMHLCRELFPTLLEQEGVLFGLLERNFAYSKFLYDDIINQQENFKDYIYSSVDVQKKEIEVLKTPKELLDEAGYILYECNTEEDIQNFKKYYTQNEELCTFNDCRLKRCYVFFAVKKNVDDVKRENFKNPNRQDEYGTSVISIQFSKGEVNTLSIKNRYNHTVNNPDATFSNNLENIIEGLTSSFERTYNLNINQNSNNNLRLRSYVKANDKKYYKYNYEVNNNYYCPNNIIIDNFEAKHYEKEKYLIIDYFILDLVNKQVKLYDQRIEDSFIDCFKDIKKIDVTKLSDNNKLITIILNNNNTAYIEIDKYNRIISYKNKTLKQITDNFLWFNETLKNIDLPNVLSIGDDFLGYNKELKELSLPKVEEIGDDFLENNKILKEILIPNIKKIGDCFLWNNNSLEKINLAKVKKIGDRFLEFNITLEKIELLELQQVGDNFLCRNLKLKELRAPKLEEIGNLFLVLNKWLTKIEIPNLIEIGDGFLEYNQHLKKIDLPALKKMGNNFLMRNEILEEINISNVEIIGDDCLSLNMLLKEINLPKIIEIGFSFLYFNPNIDCSTIKNKYGYIDGGKKYVKNKSIKN